MEQLRKTDWVAVAKNGYLEGFYSPCVLQFYNSNIYCCKDNIHSWEPTDLTFLKIVVDIQPYISLKDTVWLTSYPHY